MILLSGVTVIVKVAHVRLCHSRMLFVRAYPRETQEMVFDAHDRAFALFKGACRRGIYDTMKTAVETIFVGKGRLYNRRFLQMCSHYLVDPVACTPASGWEKGQVENQVGLVRERFFTPRLRFKTLDELNAWLLDKCIAYAKAHRHPEFADRTIWEVFEAERPRLVPYAGRFDGFHAVPASISKTCLVRFDNNKYSVAASAVGRPVEVQAYADRIVIRQDGRIVAEHQRSFGRALCGHDVARHHQGFPWCHVRPLVADAAVVRPLCHGAVRHHVEPRCGRRGPQRSERLDHGCCQLAFAALAMGGRCRCPDCDGQEHRRGGRPGLSDQPAAADARPGRHQAAEIDGPTGSRSPSATSCIRTASPASASWSTGRSSLDRVVTTYQTNSYGQPDITWLDVETRAQMVYFVRYNRQRITQVFGRKALADDNPTNNPGIVTPKIIKAECIHIYKELEAGGLVENSTAFAQALVVERSSDPNRINAYLPIDVVNQLRVFAANVTTFLQYPS